VPRAVMQESSPARRGRRPTNASSTCASLFCERSPAGLIGLLSTSSGAFRVAETPSWRATVALAHFRPQHEKRPAELTDYGDTNPDYVHELVRIDDPRSAQQQHAGAEGHRSADRADAHGQADRPAVARRQPQRPRGDAGGGAAALTKKKAPGPLAGRGLAADPGVGGGGKARGTCRDNARSDARFRSIISLLLRGSSTS
jgi:hypothetical protein